MAEEKKTPRKKAKQKGKPWKTNIPIDNYDKISIELFKTLYQNMDEEKIIYKVIENQPHTPLRKLVWQLDDEHGIRRSIGGLRKIAKNCGLPFTE